MKLTSFETIIRALNTAEVRYIIAGGLAVNAHGYLRFTKDIDLVLNLIPDNTRRALNALQSIGYKPALPVSMEQFADPEQRQQWVHDKGMTVFQLWSDQHPETPIDIFVEEPFVFDDEYQRALIKTLYTELKVPFVSVDTLIKMKQVASREQDKIDVEHLSTKQDN